MAVDKRIAAAQQLAGQMQERYGIKSASAGPMVQQKRGIVSTGSLLWDYITGCGGFPGNCGVEIFGPPELGKSTIAGFSALRNAQAQGMLTGLIAVEPYDESDEEWMIRHGINPEYNVMAWPDNGEEAFNIALDWVTGGVVDYILFDSLGAVASDKEMESDKPQAYGNSALISWGVKRLPQRMNKNNVGIMWINQVRDDTNSRIKGILDSPGGHAAKHAFKMRYQLKPGKNQYKVKISDGDENKDNVVGREIIVVQKKNKAAEQIGNNARFDFFHKETDDFPFGFDVAKDIRMAAMVSGVFEKNGAYYHHPIFPNGKLNGKAKVAEWVNENPDKIGEIRSDVLKVMTAESAKRLEAKRRAKSQQSPKLTQPSKV